MIYASLQIKQIQYDTLSHLLLTRISTLYTDQIVPHQIAISQAIYVSNENETPHEIYRAFKEGSYHNVEGFWGLWMKLRYSLTRTLLGTEVDYIALANGEGMGPTEEMSGTNGSFL
jgi:N-terminal acetyltransferase B complex non-catalytic subunit